MYHLIRICLILHSLSTVSGMNDFNLNYVSPDNDLTQDLYKRLASLDLQDVKRIEDRNIAEDVYSDGDSSPFYEAYNQQPQRNILLLPDQLKVSDSDDGYEDTSYLHSQKQLRDMEEKEEIGLGDDEKIRGVIRDPEFTEHSSIDAVYHLKDHDREHGKPTSPAVPNKIVDSLKSVKSDEALPFYCHPPNPCPKGFTSKNGCQEFVEDTADYQKEWIRQMQKKGLCNCDEEHMFNCADGLDGSDDERQDLEKVIDNLIKEKQENPFTHGGHKRVSLVAKKSPRYKRDTGRLGDMEEEIYKVAKKSSDNPYLDGARLPTVAKKGEMSKMEN
ncbi:hypothetical protein HELRODRAFT_191041 [Helobdella robusta]|uniref:Neuroendocrine protein 7B2 n=1 Tax=Helobdella robusta TaxID=6412 RepID=T1FSJ2_HELRO|nr:hypothetical protein HELRODRAFT_191041 [Helobdella robusta]ESO07797.1 hypothetical protein HELRODRAFT_191041 [Helobdella robusta]